MIKSIDHEFVNNSYNNEKIIEEYLTSNDKYGITSPELQLCLKYLKLCDNVLDAGCGVGRAGFGLYSNNFKSILGIDISAEMIKKAMEINENKKTSIKFEVQNLLELNFEENCFDAAIAFHSITPIPKKENRKKALKEIRRVLKNDSILILSTFIRELREDNFWYIEEYRWKNDLQNNKLHDYGDLIVNKKGIEVFIHIPSRIEFMSLLEESGYELLEELTWANLNLNNDNIKPAQKCKYWVVKAVK